jgi:hypothetical protein
VAEELEEGPPVEATAVTVARAGLRARAARKGVAIPPMAHPLPAVMVDM